MNKDFKDKGILVTGPASGIGRKIAKQLLENQANIIITYGNKEEKYQKEIMQEYNLDANKEEKKFIKTIKHNKKTIK